MDGQPDIDIREGKSREEERTEEGTGDRTMVRGNIRHRQT
jgi:hypothetical protein